MRFAKLAVRTSLVDATIEISSQGKDVTAILQFLIYSFTTVSTSLPNTFRERKRWPFRYYSCFEIPQRHNTRLLLARTNDGNRKIVVVAPDQTMLYKLPSTLCALYCICAHRRNKIEEFLVIAFSAYLIRHFPGRLPFWSTRSRSGIIRTHYAKLALWAHRNLHEYLSLCQDSDER